MQVDELSRRLIVDAGSVFGMQATEVKPPAAPPRCRGVVLSSRDRLAQVDVHVDESGHDHAAASMARRLVRRTRNLPAANPRSTSGPRSLGS